MKSIFEKVIQRGSYDLNGLLKRIDEYHIEGKLTDEERVHLIAAARGDATPGVDAAGEIQRLWAVVQDLVRRVAALEGGTAGGDVTDGSEVAEFREPTGAHDAYYAGAKVVYKGVTYTCVAPEGVACVWSPEVMPGYWEAADV